MRDAQRYRERATRLRELACAERNILVRRQLLRIAIRFDEFADELEARAAAQAE